jgi:hypothetical protein
MYLPLFLSSVFSLAALGICADVSAVRPASVLRGVVALAPFAAAIVLAGCR